MLTEPPLCPHGERTDRTTRAGTSLCPLCRRLAPQHPAPKAARTSRSRARGRADYAALAANDDSLDIYLDRPRHPYH
jgi:hypothetical protein